METKSRTYCESSFHNIEESLKYMYLHNLHCDVTIQATDVKDGSSMCFNAHKLILAVRSCVFADMFSKKDHNTNLIEVKCSPRAFDILLWYIYTDKIETDDVDELIKSFEVATTYKLFSFWDICVEKLNEKSASINQTNVCSVMKIANITKSNNLQKLCHYIIQKDFENIFLSDDFLTLHKNIVWDLLKESKLNVCAKQMLKTIVKWMVLKKVSDRRFLSFIDFSGLNAEDFLNIVQEFPCFFYEYEICAVLSKLTFAAPPDLPQWCNFSTANTNEKSPSHQFLYERMEYIKSNATMVQTLCNQGFRRFTLHGMSGFEQDMLLKVIMKIRTLKLAMIELTFGCEFVPLSNLVIGLSSNLNSKKKMAPLKYHLIPTLEHYYLILDASSIPTLAFNFNLLLVVKAFGLFNWASYRPISNLKYRVATVYDCSKVETVNTGIIKVVRLKPFSDWLLFANPKHEEKKFVISSLFFDTHENIVKYLN